MGDFNATVGKDKSSWKRILGSHGVGKMNSSGVILLSKCAELELCITITIFSRADKFKNHLDAPKVQTVALD